MNVDAQKTESSPLNSIDNTNKVQEETPSKERHHRGIGTIQLGVIVFFAVSGGPFGIEEAVASGGVFFSLIAFAILPWIISLPEALVTAELGSTYTEASGTVAWVEEAFENYPYLAFLQGCLAWTSGATDNAIYPVLFWEYARQLLGNDEEEGDSLLRFIYLSGTCLILAYINYRGLEAVGDMSITICVLAMSPFLVFIVVGFNQIQPSRWLQTANSIGNNSTMDNIVDENESWDISGVMWGPFLNNLFWNLNSYDSAASFAGEVKDPGRAFPKAMFLSVGFVALAYLLPLLVATGCSSAGREEWVDGYLATIVADVVGPWCGAWVVIAAGLSNLAMFQSEMSSDAYQIMGMAERGFLPQIFSRKSSKYGTPIYGIMLGVGVILLMNMSSSLTHLIEMLNFNYALSLLLAFMAFLKLRISKPELHRPYRIPLPTWGCVILLIPPILSILIIMMLASWTTICFCLGTIILSMIMWTFQQQNKKST